MQKLPHGLADPLHLQEPVLLKTIVASLLVFALLLLLGRWLGKRRRRRAEEPPPLPRRPGLPAGGLAELLEAIWRRYRETSDFRGGCHELSHVLREHFEHRVGRPLTRLTAREIGRVVDDKPLTRLLAILADLQFGRRPPGRDQFDNAYRLARALSAASSRKTGGKTA